MTGLHTGILREGGRPQPGESLPERRIPVIRSYLGLESSRIVVPCFHRVRQITIDLHCTRKQRDCNPPITVCRQSVIVGGLQQVHLL